MNLELRLNYGDNWGSFIRGYAFYDFENADRANLSDLNVRFAAHMTENEIPHTSFEFDGTHSWTSWAPVIEQALRVQVDGETLDPSIVATSSAAPSIAVTP